MLYRSVLFVALFATAWLDVVPGCRAKKDESDSDLPATTKASEAQVELARIHDRAAVYFKEEHVGSDPAVALHQCPNDGQLRGEAGITPPLSVNCNKGSGHGCQPVTGSNSEGQYDPALWKSNPVWKALLYAQEGSHNFHYNFIWANNPEGHGACQFTIQAFADLDDDGVYSTYERYGAGDVEGVHSAEGIYIVNELE